jgi:hypothetical protein
VKDLIVVEEEETEREVEVIFVPIFVPTFDQGAYQPPVREPCAFDGLPPGVYGLVCFCPRCSPRCTAVVWL